MKQAFRFPAPKAIVALALLGLAAAPGPGRAAPTDFPVSATGDIWFQADHAGFMRSDGTPYEEYYFKVTDNQLQFNRDGDVYRGRVFVHLEFKDADGNGLGEAGHDYAFTVPDLETAGSPDHAQLLLLRDALDPRAATVEVTMEDLNARKRGLLYMVTGKRKNGSAEGILAPPPFLGKPFGVSDIQFAWEVHEGASGGPFIKNGLDVVPNPSRNYGLLQSRVSAYYEVYDRRDTTSALPHTYFVTYDIVNPDGKTVNSVPDTVQSDAGDWMKVMTFDATGLTTGEYQVKATVRDSASGETAVSERPFNVLWRSGAWDRTEQDVLDEARVLFTEKEYARFRDMSAGDRELYLEKFWADADPSPGSARNEIRDEFMRRVAYAERHFSAGGKGMVSDQGRIYIRFGEPDEVEREVLPTRDRQLDRQVDELSAENPSGKLLATNDEVDTRPYEIWIYTQQGHPLFPDREFTTSKTGLKFVFVDETGTGHYVLRFSSDFIGY